MSVPTSATYKSDIYANIRQVDAQIDFTYNNVKTTYDDTKIIKMNIVEEISTLNDTIPSDQLTLTLDNSDGAFNFLNLSNMQTIIASRPQIDVRLGLNEANLQPATNTDNFVGKVKGDLTACGNLWKYISGASGLQAPSAFSSEASQASYNAVQSLDGTYDTTSTTTSGYQPQDLYCFDIIRILTDFFGAGIWGGKTLLSDKVALAKTFIASITTNAYVYGSAPTGNKAYSKWWNGSSWSTGSSNTANTFSNIAITSTNMNTYIGSDGFLYMLVTTDASDGVTASKNMKDYVEIVITTNAIYTDEFIPMGSFWVDSWKNDVGALTITLTAHDNFTMLDNIQYPNTGAGMTLYNLAVDVFNTAGITNYSIDNSLKNITATYGFPKKLSCRSALQNIGIAGMSCVYQDRNGTMVIKPFATLDASLLYSNYPSNGQRTLWGYPSGNASTYNVNNIINNTDGGMRYLSLANMYEIPEITLDKSIYQVQVNVYGSGGSTTPSTYTNSTIAGTNGQSFTIDNPLIDTVAKAQSVANWFITESNYNAVYKANWRQNPCLQATDVVIIESGFQSGQNNVIKQTRIYKQEFNYSGYLSGNTESRGGL